MRRRHELLKKWEKKGNAKWVFKGQDSRWNGESDLKNLNLKIKTSFQRLRSRVRVEGCRDSDKKFKVQRERIELGNMGQVLQQFMQQLLMLEIGTEWGAMGNGIFCGVLSKLVRGCLETCSGSWVSFTTRVKLEKALILNFQSINLGLILKSYPPLLKKICSFVSTKNVQRIIIYTELYYTDFL